MKSVNLKWAYGVTTVWQRRYDLLPRTLESLQKAGFGNPRLFIDGARNGEQYAPLCLETTVYCPKLGIYGAWVLSMWELYLREPQADRYVIFQDDLVAYRNLRQYLEACPFPEQGYWNLYTFPQNQSLANGRKGWFPSNQHGKSALALVFSSDGVKTLMMQPEIMNRAQHASRRRSVDGGVCNALHQQVKWVEYTHNPSLVQHTGHERSTHNRHNPLAPEFRGENYDATDLLCSGGKA